ncbi:mRNA splicing protein prp18 [Apophysomyces sp. BC1034]|nr:mRNA splicing protein prp18 [Apophysomyces sp. BC1015]KAG0182358.1 mRNA splicing protein prp18 [Apophysomyces sp. BC1021]KAG0194522.1 mRNA splicing protein prp18 [Apophysomyces sp. BC1034]
MDFLKSAIDAEISKKRKVMTMASEKAGNKKYVSRAELERMREEDYQREEAERVAKEKEKKEKLRQEQERLKEQEKQQAKSDDKTETPDEEVEIETFNISRDEAVRRLRAKGQPIRLFGETDKQCKIRLRALELMEERSEDQGQRNDFMRKLEEMEEGMKLDVLKQKGGVMDDKKDKKSKKAELIVAPIQLKLLQSDRDKLFMQIYAYLVHSMEEWEEAMAARPEDEKRSGQGKRAAVVQKQTAEYIKPLLRQLKKRTLEPDILARVAEITHHMQNRRYRDAQDSYLQLSIGNAPWPIGVTMVGIHERSAREKIFSSQVAHVLNDETSRKWIQSVKRLMTFAQSKYPPHTLSQIS